MSERQKLLDAARSAVNLLTNVLGNDDDDSGCHGNLNNHQQYAVTEIPKNDTNSVPAGENVDRNTELPEGKVEPIGTSPLKTKLFYDFPTQTTMTIPRLSMRRATPVAMAIDDRARDDTYLRHEKHIMDRRFTQRIPSQVAKVTPQRPVPSEKRDESITDGSPGNGGFNDSRTDGWDRGFNEFVMEQAQASSLLVLENAKLRDELYEVKSELTTLKLETKPEIDRKDAEVQTICASIFGDNLYRIPHLITSDDEEETSYLSYSISPDQHYRGLRKELLGAEKRGGSDVYFTPDSNASTPVERGGLIKRKLELPKSLKNGGGYFSLTNSYDAMPSDDDDNDDNSSAESPGCCPLVCCFGRLGRKKNTRN